MQRSRSPCGFPNSWVIARTGQDAAQVPQPMQRPWLITSFIRSQKHAVVPRFARSMRGFKYLPARAFWSSFPCKEQVRHDSDVPYELRARGASGDVDIHVDEIPDGEEGLVLGLVVLPAAAEPGDVPVACAGAEGHHDLGLLPRLLYLLHRFMVLDADRSLDERHVHLRDMPDVGKREAVDEVGVVVQDLDESQVVVGHGHEAAGTAAQVYMPELDLVCHWFRLLCVKQFHSSSLFPSVSRIQLREWLSVPRL